MTYFSGIKLARELRSLATVVDSPCQAETLTCQVVTDGLGGGRGMPAPPDQTQLSNCLGLGMARRAAGQPVRNPLCRLPR